MHSESVPTETLSCSLFKRRSTSTGTGLLSTLAGEAVQGASSSESGPLSVGLVCSESGPLSVGLVCSESGSVVGEMSGREGRAARGDERRIDAGGEGRAMPACGDAFDLVDMVTAGRPACGGDGGSRETPR